MLKTIIQYSYLLTQLKSTVKRKTIIERANQLSQLCYFLKRKNVEKAKIISAKNGFQENKTAIWMIKLLTIISNCILL